LDRGFDLLRGIEEVDLDLEGVELEGFAPLEPPTTEGDWNLDLSFVIASILIQNRIIMNQRIWSRMKEAFPFSLLETRRRFAILHLVKNLS